MTLLLEAIKIALQENLDCAALDSIFKFSFLIRYNGRTFIVGHKRADTIRIYDHNDTINTDFPANHPELIEEITKALHAACQTPL